MSFVITCNKPYYPTVDYAETMEAARAQMQRIIDDHSMPDGANPVKVTIAEVILNVDIKTDY